MRKILIPLIMLLIGLIISLIYADNKEQCVVINQMISNSDETQISTSRYYGNIENGSLRLHNNIWGLTDIEKENKSFKSFIYYKSNGNFGWEWDRPDPSPSEDTYIPPIYPEVIVGKSLRPDYSTTDYFPIIVGDIEYLISDIEYTYTKTPTDSYNLAYDIWFIDNKGDKMAEIMIWLYGSLNYNPDTYVTDGINEYKYYHREPGNGNPTWHYYAFILKQQDPILYSHKVDIKKLIDMLLNANKLDTNWTVPGIELGNEIWSGSGRIEINRLNINLNGKDLN